MCTIGNAFLEADEGAYSFKQCDLMSETQFFEPQITEGKDDILYFPFLRDGSRGPWAGVNNFGVSFVAADAYLQLPNKSGTQPPEGDIFEAYTKIISDCKTAKQAATCMCDFYKSFSAPDILLINDASSSFFIETNNRQPICVERNDRFFASTNHFRLLEGGVTPVQNHSTYLRLERANSLLEKDPDAFGVFSTLTDQYFGSSVLSVCREKAVCPSQEEPYYTQASVVFYVDGTVVHCSYQLNGNPRNNHFTTLSDVFGQAVVTQGSADDSSMLNIFR